MKKGGVFARFANHPYGDKGRPQLDRCIQSLYKIYMPHSQRPLEFCDKDAEKIAGLALKYGFTDTQHHLFHRTRSFSAKEYIALLGTYSDHIALEESARNEFYTLIAQAIEDFGGQITLYDTLDLELARKG